MVVLISTNSCSLPCLHFFTLDVNKTKMHCSTSLIIQRVKRILLTDNHFNYVLIISTTGEEQLLTRNALLIKAKTFLA